MKMAGLIILSISLLFTATVYASEIECSNEDSPYVLVMHDQSDTAEFDYKQGLLWHWEVDDLGYATAELSAQMSCRSPSGQNKYSCAPISGFPSDFTATVLRNATSGKFRALIKRGSSTIAKLPCQRSN